MPAIRNIGIFAHVDAGKTTLSEQLLLRTGVIRSAGSVDAGTAHTDALPVEKRRGISVKATCVQMQWKDVHINLIDTPGHVDFSAEVERSLWALDAAVLVICAVEGVQPHTETLFRAMRDQKIPVLFFINKCDREGADVKRVMGQLRRRLSHDTVLWDDEEGVCDIVCSHDDALAERYLAGEVLPWEMLHDRMVKLSCAGKAYLALSGSALRGEGIDELLNAMVDVLPAPQENQTLCGVVFATARDKLLGRGVWVRLFGGVLNNRDAVSMPAGVDPSTGEMRTVERKITQIRDSAGNDVGMLGSGQIGVLYGLGNIEIGFALGKAALLPRHVVPGRLKTPLITVQVLPEKAEDMQSLRAACDVLSSEDPLLEMSYAREMNQLSLHVMGTIQLEVLQEVLLTRFGLKVSFSKPEVIYRETIAKTSIGQISYTMPKPCWAELRISVEPAPRGSGVSFQTTTPSSVILTHYQNQVRQAIPLALRQGRMGWQVTDVCITLIGGSYHLVHTHPLDFIVATPWAVQDALQKGGTVLLEPILDVQFLLPPRCVGRVISDVASMRGEVKETLSDEDRVLMNALIPAATSFDYATKLASITSGQGAMSVRLSGYRECKEKHTAQRRGVDPLDTARYILAARNALEGGIFDTD